MIFIYSGSLFLVLQVNFTMPKSTCTAVCTCLCCGGDGNRAACKCKCHACACARSRVKVQLAPHKVKLPGTFKLTNEKKNKENILFTSFIPYSIKLQQKNCVKKGISSRQKIALNGEHLLRVQHTLVHKHPKFPNTYDDDSLRSMDTQMFSFTYSDQLELAPNTVITTALTEANKGNHEFHCDLMTNLKTYHVV